MGIRKTRWLKLILAVVLIFSNIGMMTSFAEETDEVSSKAAFTDISSHWGKKYIVKMALLDIVKGKGEGIFDPDSAVTRQEAVLMALRLAGLEDNAERDVVSDVISNLGFGVDDYFKSYINYAFHAGLITPTEELNSNGRVNWGTQAASREWIAKLTIRTIGEEEQTTSTTVFSDNDEISAWALGFVNAASELKIVTGSNGAFNPSDPVTRAELATFLSRAEPYLEQRSSKVAVGVVGDVSSTGFTLVSDSGAAVTYSYAASPILFSYEQSAPIQQSDIEPMDRLFVIQEAGAVYYAEIMDSSEAMSKTEGIYLRSDLQNWTLDMNEDGIETNYQLNRSFSIVSEDGSGMDYASLVSGSEIEVSYLEVGSSKTIQVIKVLKVPVNKTSTGELQELSMDTDGLTIYDDGTGELEQYPLNSSLMDPDKEITYGELMVKLSQLATGDEIRYVVSNSVVTGIELLEPVKPILLAIQGEVDFNRPESRTLYMKTDEGAVGYGYADKVDVTLEGKPITTIEDVATNDKVTIYLNESNKVVKVEISNRSITSMHMIPFFSFDEVSQTIVARDQQQKLVFYYLTPNSVIRDREQVIDVKELSDLLDGEDKFDMIYSTGTNEIMELNVSDEYEGTIDSIDTANQLLTIINKDGYELTFPLQTTTSYEIAGSRTSKLQNFTVGDVVTIDLNSNQSAAGAVKKQETKEYTVVSVNTSTRKVKLKDKLQQEEELTLPSTTTILASDKLNPTISDLKVGRTVIVSYVGKTPVEVQLPTISFGKVTSVDASGGTFTMTDYNNDDKSATYNLAGKDIEVNDRVYVVKNVDGTLTHQVLVSFEKTIYSLNESTRTIIFLKKSANDKNIFQLHENVAVRRNDASIGLSSLTSNTAVTGYVYNDTVIELALR